jgi:DMATS type aromatic prenyltransferase
VAPYLGNAPAFSQQQWNSFMTDDGSPIELSWCWREGENRSLPAVRYSIEPVGMMAGSKRDPWNLFMSKKFLKNAKANCRTIDLKWFHQLGQILIWKGDQVTSPEGGQQNSQLFFAFDLVGSDTILKAYFMPELKARNDRCSTFSLITKAVSSLSLDPSTSSAFEIFFDYLHTTHQRAQDLEIEILAIDCIQPCKSRIKIYVRSQRTSFNDVVEAMTLGGRIRDQGCQEAIRSLKQLWSSVLSLDINLPPSKRLPSKDHRTAGILYYFEFKPGSPAIKSKVYIPVRHYGVDDFEIACGLSQFLESRGMSLYGTTYVNAVQRLW